MSAGVWRKPQTDVAGIGVYAQRGAALYRTVEIDVTSVGDDRGVSIGYHRLEPHVAGVGMNGLSAFQR